MASLTELPDIDKITRHQSCKTLPLIGSFPLYPTFESFESERATDDEDGDFSSGDDDHKTEEDEQTQIEVEKEEIKTEEIAEPVKAKRVRSVKFAVAENTTTKFDVYTKKSPKSSHQKSSTETVIQSPKVQNKKQGRKRAQTGFFRLSKESFNHFHIKRISIARDVLRNWNADLEQQIAKENLKSKCTYIESEIIETEQTYINGLNILLHELIHPMFEQNLIDKKYQMQVFSNIPKLLAFHNKFLSELTDANDSNQSVSKVFIKQNKDKLIKLYSEYVASYDAILDLFANMVKNVELQKFLKQKRRERKPLTNYLILPIQRIPRYILLLHDLCKNTDSNNADYANKKLALQSVEAIAVAINEQKRVIEQQSTLLKIQESLTGLTESIVKANRQFLTQFVFVKKSNSRQRIVFCFNDIVIIANSKLKVKHILDVRTIEIKLQKTDHEFAEFNLLHPKSKNVYISKTTSDVEKFQGIIKENRMILMDTDLAKENDTSEIRKKLKEQGVSQADDYQMEVKRMKSNRTRGNASVDKDLLSKSAYALFCE